MSAEQSLNLNHVENTKKREWEFKKFGITSKLMALLKKNFPHYLYEDSNQGFSDVRDGKSFEISLFTYKNEGRDITVSIPSMYFRNEGYNEIVSFIDKQVK